MKLEEFAFLNQQLAGMLQSGIPLEGALRRLSSDMSKGRLRDELQSLERDLANGIPLGEAISGSLLLPWRCYFCFLLASGFSLVSDIRSAGDYPLSRRPAYRRLRPASLYSLKMEAPSIARSI